MAGQFLYVLQLRAHSLRVTPAMAAGVTDKLWEIADIVALIEAKEAEKPAVRGPHNPYNEIAWRLYAFDDN